MLALGETFGFSLLYLAYQFNKAYARDRDEVEGQIRLLNQGLEARPGANFAAADANRRLEARSEGPQRSNAGLLKFAYIAS